MRKQTLISVIVLCIGIIIYILFKFDVLNKSNIILAFIRNYLLDGLWAMSFSFAIVYFFKNISKKYLLITSLYVILMGIIFEVLQFVHFVNGTFDYIDIMTYIIFAIISYFIEKYILEVKNEKN